jgi:hypothetical protein
MAQFLVAWYVIKVWDAGRNEKLKGRQDYESLLNRELNRQQKCKDVAMKICLLRGRPKLRPMKANNLRAFDLQILANSMYICKFGALNRAQVSPMEKPITATM